MGKNEFVIKSELRE